MTDKKSCLICGKELDENTKNTYCEWSMIGTHQFVTDKQADKELRLYEKESNRE